MKKIDYIIIIIAIFLSVGLIIGFYSTNRLDEDKLVIQIEYRNDLIYQHSVDEDVSITLQITSLDDVISVTVLGSNYQKNYYDKAIPNPLDYEVLIEGGNVQVIKSNCLNHYCMHMSLNSKVKSPIICTDGLLIKYKSNIDMDITTGE